MYDFSLIAQLEAAAHRVTSESPVPRPRKPPRPTKKGYAATYLRQHADRYVTLAELQVALRIEGQEPPDRRQVYHVMYDMVQAGWAKIGPGRTYRWALKNT
jgi:hypothetical protein